MSGPGIDSVVLLCFALCVMFVFVSESCLIISMCNVVSTRTVTFKDVFLFFLSCPPGDVFE